MSELLITISIDDDGDYKVSENNQYDLYYETPEEVSIEVFEILKQREEENK